MKKRYKYIIIGVVSILILGVSIPLAVGAIKGKPSKNEEINNNQTQILERPTDGSLPKDHSVLENIRIAAGVIYNNPHFRTVSEGHAITNMVIQNDQFVHTERFVDGRNNSMTNYYTTSTFKNEAFQRYFGEDRVCIRKGDVDKNTFNVTYNPGDPSIYSLDYAKENIGWFPYQMTSYIFSEETIIDAQVIDNPNYDYYAKVILDTEKSIAQTKREVKLNGGALDYPTYSKVEVSIGMSNDWTVREIHNEEIYKLSVKMGVMITAPAETNMTEYFYYDNYQIGDDVISYYSNYLDINIGDTPIVSVEKTATDYLMDSLLGIVLDGGTLDVNAMVGDYQTTGKIYVKFDIASFNANVTGLFDDLYFKYDGDMKLSYRKHNYLWDSSFFTYIIDALNVDINSLLDQFTGSENGSDSSTDGLLSQLGNMQMEKVNYEDGTKDVTISGKMDAQGVALDYSILLFEDQYGALLKQINVDALYEGQNAKFVIDLAREDIIFEEKEYVDLSNTTWVVDEAINLSSYQGYDIDMDYVNNDYDVSVNGRVDDKKQALVRTTISKENYNPVDVDIYYYENEYYFFYGGLEIKATSKDVKDIINEISLLISEYFSDGKVNIDTPTVDINNILNTSYELFDGITSNSSNDIIVSMAMSTIFENTEDAKLVLSQNEDSLCFEAEPYNFNMRVKEYKERLSLDIEKEYLTRKEFDKTVDYVLQLYEMTKQDIVRIDITNSKVEFDGNSYLVNGYLGKQNDAYEAFFTLEGKENLELKLIYQEDMYYLTLNGDKSDVNVKFSSEEFYTFINDVANESYTLIEEYQVREYIDSIIKEYKDLFAQQELNVKQIVDIIYSVLLESKDIKVIYGDNTINITYKDDYHINFTKEKDGFSFDLSEFSYETIKINGNVGIYNNFTLSTYDELNYVNIDKVLHAVDQIFVEFAKSDITLEDITNVVKDVSSYQGYNIVINTTYLDYDLELIININQDLKVNGKITLVKDGKESLDLNLYYIDEKLYFEYGNIGLKVTKEDLGEVFNLLNNSSDIPSMEAPTNVDDIQNVINKVFDIYQGITISSDNKIDISLLLSNLTNNAKDITLRMYYVDNTIHMDIPEYDVYSTIKEYIPQDTDYDLNKEYYFAREDLEEIINDYNDILTSVKDEQFVITIEDINIKINQENYLINGEVRVNKGDYQLQLIVSTSNENLDLRVTLIEGIYYLDCVYQEYELHVQLEEAQLLKLIEDINASKQGLVKDSEITELKEYIEKTFNIDFSQDTTLEETDYINLVYDALVYLKGCKLTNGEGGFRFINDHLNASFNKNNNQYILTVNNFVVDNIQVNGIVRFENSIDEINKYSSEYINIDEVIVELDGILLDIASSDYTLYDLFNEAYKIVNYKDYHIEIDYVYETYLINMKVDVLSNGRIKGYIVVTQEGLEPLELTLIYQDNLFYVTYGNVNFVANQEDIKDVMNLIIGSDKTTNEEVVLDYQEIINKACIIFDSFHIDEENNINLGLAFNVIFNNVPRINVSLKYYDDHLEIINNEYGVRINVSKSDETIDVDLSKDYLSREDVDLVYGYYNDIYGIIESNKYTINLDEIEVLIDNKTYHIGGTIIVNNGKYYGLINVTGDINIQLEVSLLDDYYIALTYENNEEIKVKLTKEITMKIIDEIINNQNIFLDNLTIAEFIEKHFGIKISLDNQNEDTLLTVYKALAEVIKAYIEVKDGEVKLSYSDYALSLNKIDNTYDLGLTLTNIDKVSINAQLSLSNECVIPSIDDSTFYDATGVEDVIDQIINVFIDNTWSIDDAINLFNELTTYQGYRINISNINIEKLVVSGVIYYDLNNNIKMELTISYLEDTTNMVINGCGNDYYLIWENYTILINKEDINDIVSLISGDSTAVTNYYDVIDYALEIFGSINGDNNVFNVFVSLSKIYNELVDTNISIDYNDGIYISSSMNNISLSVVDYVESIDIPEIDNALCLSRYDFNVLYDYYQGTLSYISEGKFSLDIDEANPINIVMDNMNLIINGSINVSLVEVAGQEEKKVTFSAELYITGSMHYYFALQYGLDERLYISFSVDWDEQTKEVLTPMIISFSRQEIIDLFTVILNNIDEDSEIGKTMDNFDTLNQIKSLIVSTGLINGDVLKPNKVDMKLSSIVPMVFKILDFLKGATFDINQDKVIHVEKEYVIPNEVEDIYTLSIIDLLQISSGENIDYLINISQLKLGNITISGGLKVSKFEDDIVFEIGSAINMDGLSTLGEGLFNSINKMKFLIEGQLTMKLLGIYNVNIKMDARVKYVDGEIQGYIHFNVPYVLAATNSTGGANSYVFFTKDMIYMRKDAVTSYLVTSKTKTTFRKCTYQEFMNNMIDNIVYLLDFTNLIANAMQKDNTFVITEDKFLKSYAYNSTESSHSLVLDLAGGLGTTMFSEDLVLKITNSINSSDNKSYLKRFNGSLKVFSVIGLTFDFEEKAGFGAEVVFDESLVNSLFNQSL